MIAQYLEDLDENYVVYSNITELGPIDLVVVNLETGKSVFVDYWWELTSVMWSLTDMCPIWAFLTKQGKIDYG